MRRWITVLVAAGLFALLPGGQSVAAEGDPGADRAEERRPNGWHAFSLVDIDGQTVSLDRYEGKVVLLVNVASKCGFTSQYAGLQKLYERYRERGLVILGIPANDFMNQEPGTEAEIKTFCSTRYGVTFPLFSNISVKGKEIDPLYRWLTAKETNPGFAGDIEWNFTKYLAGKDGTILARFGTRVAPDSKELVETIEKALAG